jgi:UDP-N-acetylglucosamine--N-acetylmuramyl-(pentapeptide) pyrophosphoryl-undecaprenol N-acetylglucosamine transferase
MRLKRLAITCGGTGGHFYPGLTIAREFKARGGDVILLLSGKNVNSQAEVAEKYGIQAIKLKTMPSPGSPKRAVQFVIGSICGVVSSLKTMRKFRPEALLGMGSFASLPAIVAAKLLKVPLFLHDGNARIGKANRIFSRWGRHLGTAFPAVNAETVKCSCECTGMPIRPELKVEKISKNDAVNKLNEKYGSSLHAELPTILIFGGSQGAQIFNETFPTVIKEVGGESVQVLHLSGPGKLDKVNEIYSKASFPVLALESASEMHLFYQAADAAICRSGGSTVAELCYFGKYAFLIPYPYAAEKHQDDNARFLESTGAAEIIDNADCNEKHALAIIQKWLNDCPALSTAGVKSLESARPEAAVETINIIDSMID